MAYETQASPPPGVCPAGLLRVSVEYGAVRGGAPKSAIEIEIEQWIVQVVRSAQNDHRAITGFRERLAA